MLTLIVMYRRVAITLGENSERRV